MTQYNILGNGLWHPFRYIIPSLMYLGDKGDADLIPCKLLLGLIEQINKWRQKKNNECE